MLKSDPVVPLILYEADRLASERPGGQLRTQSNIEIWKAYLVRYLLSRPRLTATTGSDLEKTILEI